MSHDTERAASAFPIRRATTTDAEAIARVHVQAWQAAYAKLLPAAYLAALSIDRRAAAWQQRLQDGNGLTLVHEADGAITGWIDAGSGRDEDTADSCEIYAVYIAPSHWRRGIGRQLMRQVEASLPASRDLSLWVFRDNAPALSFYASLGYHPDGNEKRRERGGKSLNEIRLRKQR
jgi:ribosomal protein S18 acetylase RimI-like enzyme